MKDFYYSRKIDSPITAQIEITDQCNERCKHCYNTWQFTKSIFKTLTNNEIDRIVEELGENNVFHTTITWWEPLLHKEQTFYTISKLLDKWISTTMNSNLTLVDEKTAKKLQDSWLKFILTSLISSNKDVHNMVTQKSRAFEMWLEWVENIKKYTNIWLWANMVLTQYNKNDVYETWKFLNDLGIKHFFVTRGSFPTEIRDFERIAVSWEETLKWLEQLIKVKEDFSMKVIDILECYPLCFLADDERFHQFTNHKCTAWIWSITIWVSWDVRACAHSNVNYWNIFTEDLKNIWSKMDDWRNWDYLPEKCKKCEHLSDCSWWCRLDAEWSNGNIRDMDPFAKEENISKVQNIKKYNIIKLESLKYKTLKIVNNIIIRKEKDGYLIGKWLNQVYVTNDSWELVQYLKILDKFSISSIIQEFDVNEDVLDKFLFLLYKKDIIQIL